MRRPWHYWLLYLIGLLMVAATLGWVTQQALRLDRAEAIARRQAELEESIGRALWRMDVRLMPLIAKEAARPYFVYQPFYSQPQPPGTPTAPANASPLLTERPEFILVNFQVDSANHWSSAQLPKPDQYQLALSCGAQAESIAQCETKLNDLQSQVSYPALLSKLPVESIDEKWAQATWRDEDTGKFLENALLDTASGQEASPVPQQAAPAVQTKGRYQMETTRLQRQQTLNTSDLANRDAQVQFLAKQEFETQRANLKGSPTSSVREGICRPVWIGDRLLLARRVQWNDQTVIQGCWLDWPRIRQTLSAEVADLLPKLELQPVFEPARAQANRMLATLPVQLIVSAPPVADAWTPMRTTLSVAWVGTILFALAGGLLLHGILALSERRATFVSAVTHELRTPLTTFRLYSDMLAQGMLPHPQQRQKYLETLRIEADRLVRLVDNVLSFARLERGRSPQQRIPITIEGLLERCRDRLNERAAQAGLELLVELNRDLNESSVVTDPSAVEQILFNLVDNAAKYAGRGEDRRLHLKAARSGRWIEIRLSDHGPGLAVSAQRRLFQPFSKSVQDAAHSAPGVGLGLALCKRLAHDVGGKLSLESNTAGGATFLLRLPVQNQKKA